jgi:hypothetical protein
MLDTPSKDLPRGSAAMFTDIAIDVDYLANWETGARKQYPLYLPGATLLQWAQDAAKAVLAGASAPQGSGSALDPYLVVGHGGFAGAWKVANAARNREVHFKIAGRLIHKLANKASGGFADGCYMADVAYSGTDPTQGTIWNRADGASYREFGKFMHAGNAISGMEGVVWSQHIASAMRQVIKGKTGGHAGALSAPIAKQQATGSRWQVDMNQDESARKAPQKISDGRDANKADSISALPLLSAVMFIAEPMRNPRAWLMGQILLDLMGAEYSPMSGGQHGKHFTFQRAFVHPKRLDDPAWSTEVNLDDTAPSAWVNRQAGVNNAPAPTKAQKEIRKTATKMRNTGSAAVEGLFPPSPKWSARTSSAIDVANDYIQAKEVSLLCRWLEQEFNAYVGSVVTARAVSGVPGGRRNALTADFGTETAMRGFGADIERVIKTELIARRAESFNSPGVLFK